MKTYYLRGVVLLAGVAFMGLSCPNNLQQIQEGPTLDEVLESPGKMTMDDCDHIKAEYDLAIKDGADHTVTDEIVQRHVACLYEVNGEVAE